MYFQIIIAFGLTINFILALLVTIQSAQCRRALVSVGVPGFASSNGKAGSAEHRAEDGAS